MINKIKRRLEGRPLNILCMPTHERYETNLAKTGHNFFSLQFPNFRKWNPECGEPPSNYSIRQVQPLPNNQLNLNIPSLQWDYVLSQEKTQQFEQAHGLSQHFNAPLISLEHTAPIPEWPPSFKSQWQERRGHKNVFITEWSKNAWEMEGAVINHGIDTTYFSPSDSNKDSVVLSVVQNWKERDAFCGFRLWQAATAGVPTRVIGNNPGLSEPAKSLDELRSIYQDSAVFLNTSLISPVPTTLLEAMSCGMAVVSTPTCDIPNIIQSGENGILAETPEEIGKACKRLLNDPTERKRLGDNARQTIVEKYNLDRFIKEWNNIFYG